MIKQLDKSMDFDNKIFGICEYISIPNLGIDNVVAKIDTGAYSGALHCSKIEEKKWEENGKKKRRLLFTPSDKHSHATEIKKYAKTYVRSSTGHRIKRYLFDTEITINNITYKIRIGLSDRSDMNYEILIGRKFLSENNILVDCNKNKELDIDREKKL